MAILEYSWPRSVVVYFGGSWFRARAAISDLHLPQLQTWGYLFKISSKNSCTQISMKFVILMVNFLSSMILLYWLRLDFEILNPATTLLIFSCM